MCQNLMGVFFLYLPELCARNAFHQLAPNDLRQEDTTSKSLSAIIETLHNVYRQYNLHTLVFFLNYVRHP